MLQIAEAAGVSVTTVSHALSGKRPVRPETVVRIQRLVEQHGFVPNSSGVRLQSGRSRVIGLAVPDISHWYFGSIAKGVEQRANERDYGLIICGTMNADPRSEKRYFNMLRTRSIDGLVYTTSRSTSDLHELVTAARGSSIVLADEAIAALPEIPSVTTTVGEGARHVGHHLRDLGHTRAVVIAGFAGLGSTTERIEAFRESFPNALVLYGDFEQRSGYDAMGDLLANEVTFTCVFAHNDFMAIGAIRRLREHGLRVPEDISVVGFDDVDIATVVTPALTTVRKDMVEIGRRSADILLDLINGTAPAPRSEVLPVELVVRGTTGPAPRS
ncbi:MAG: LacI family transcriptional regulator [Frondihabitans sp.]|nr:LacI family transcriptional regulator [Frondihabitans sp.]